MRRTRSLGLAALAVLLLLTACDPPTPPQYPTTIGTPLDPPTGPAFTVDLATMQGAWGCTTYNPSSTWEPILLVASGTIDATSWRSQWATAGRFAAAAEVCVITIPVAGDIADFTRAAQYIATAVTDIAALTSQDVDVVAHSRGGLDARWALRWWPGIRGLVDDVVTIGVPNKGSVDNMYLTSGSAPVPIFQQSRADAQFIHALNSGPDQTPGTSHYTNIASEDDRDSVGDGLRDTRTEPWKMSGATNLLVQTHCAQIVTRPAVRDHGWVWAATLDALTNTGPAVATRFNPTAPCTAANVSDPPGTSYGTAVTSNSEPPLPDYVPMVAEVEPTWDPAAIAALPDTQPDPHHFTLTEKTVDRDAAIVCPTGPDARYAPDPVLLVPGGAGIHDLDPADGVPDMWADFEGRFDDPSGDPVCWLKLPPPVTGGPTLNLARGAQFVVHAVRTLSTAASSDVDIITHSRGGFDTAWALRWWSDVPSLVDDVVILDSPLHGSRAQMAPPPPGPPPALMLTPMGHQSRADSLFVAALLLEGAMPGPASWTTIGTWDANDGPTDPDPYGGASVGRGAYDQRQYAWRWPGATNMLVQQHCPGRRVNHGEMTTDDWVWAAIADALGNAGPAVPSRFVPSTPCGTATYVMFPRQAGVTFTPTTNTEPSLSSYGGYVWDMP